MSLPYAPIAPPLEPWFPLATKRLVLREFRATDFEDIQAYAEDPEVVRYMEWGPNSPEMTRQFLDLRLSDQRTWPRLAVSLAVELKETARVIGAVRFDTSDAANRSGEVGYTLHRDAWGQGLGAEAAGALAGVAFETVGLHRPWATCDVRNAGSARVLEKIGMRRQGLLRGHLQGRDGWRDSYLYAMLAEDWHWTPR